MSKFREVTSSEVCAAMLATGRTWFGLRDCSLCGSEIGYSTDNDELWFHPDCNCTTYRAPPEPRSFFDIARTINLQTEHRHRVAVAARFGLDLSGEDAPEPVSEGGEK